MNKVILMGRLTRDPEVRYSAGENALAIARYTLAVDRRFRRDGEANADFINCVAFGRNGEFAEKYLHKGTKILAEGRIQTGSYTNKDGVKVYTTEVVVENQEFAEVAPLDEQGYIKAGEDCKTETEGVFVAGDCRTKTVRQLTTAAADGAVAALAACEYLG